MAKASYVRINGTVHPKTALPGRAVVPIGWVAVGNPAAILPPDRHEEIWALQEPLDFPREIFGVARSEEMMTQIMDCYTRGLARHAGDRIVGQ